MKQVQQQMNLLTRFPYLANYTRITLLRLINNFKREDITRNTLLFKQGEPFTHFYLILHGEFDQLWHNTKHADRAQSSPPKSARNKYNVNQTNVTSEDHHVAILSSFHTCGLEEWIAGSETYLTTVKCISAAGEVTDPALAELYEIFFKLNSGQKPTNSKKGKTKKLLLQNAKLLKIKKESFLKIVGGKNNQSAELCPAQDEVPQGSTEAAHQDGQEAARRGR